MKLDIFIVAYKAEKELAAALSSIALWSKPGYRLTVYDNVVHNYPLTWLWNQFIRQSNAEYIALVNPDVVVGPGWDAECLDLLALNPSCAVAMPLSNYPPHEGIHKIPKMTYDWFDEILVVTGDIKRKFPNRFYLLPERTLVSGHCMFVRKSAWLAVGGLNEGFPFANNDYDFNTRLIAKGMTLGVSLHSVVYHAWGASTRDAKASGAFAPGKQLFSQPPPGATFSTI